MTFEEYMKNNVGSEITDIINGWRDSDENAYTHWNVDNYQTNYTCNECGAECDGNDDECSECESSDITGDMQSPENYFVVTAELADKLSEAGEVVIREFSTPIWGKCEHGIVAQSEILHNIYMHIYE